MKANLGLVNPKGKRRRKCAERIGRSENMRRIRSRDTKPELLLRRALYARGLRYRLHVSTLPGKPDIVFGSKRLVIFIHGCFWHQHPGCGEASNPRSNATYWMPKLVRNVERDRQHEEKLKELGYRVLVMWECDIEKALAAAVTQVLQALS